MGDKHAKAVAAAQHQAPQLSADDALSALAKLAMQQNSTGQSAEIAQGKSQGYLVASMGDITCRFNHLVLIIISSIMYTLAMEGL